MPHFPDKHTVLAILAVISAVLTVVGPGALADTVDVRAVIKDHYEHHLNELRLTAAREASLRRILEQNISERTDLFERHGLTPGNKPSFLKMLSLRADMRELVRNHRARLAQVLTEEQLAHWQHVEDALRTKIRTKMSGQ